MLCPTVHLVRIRAVLVVPPKYITIDKIRISCSRRMTRANDLTACLASQQTAFQLLAPIPEMTCCMYKGGFEYFVLTVGGVCNTYGKEQHARINPIDRGNSITFGSLDGRPGVDPSLRLTVWAVAVTNNALCTVDISTRLTFCVVCSGAPDGVVANLEDFAMEDPWFESRPERDYFMGHDARVFIHTPKRYRAESA